MSDPNTTREWMLVCDAKGKSLYWVAADGERREPRDQPPSDQWAKEMLEALHDRED